VYANDYICGAYVNPVYSNQNKKALSVIVRITDRGRVMREV
jgi:hypothetical protein